MKTRQFDFFTSQREHAPCRLTHGGRRSKGLRKIARPLDSRRPIHLVLKSSHARGRLNFLTTKNRPLVEKIVREWARYFHVKIHGFENVGSHLHIIASFPKRECFGNFLRTVTALIAREVTGSRKGRPFGKRFWDDLAFTRVIAGWRDFRGMKNYLFKNHLEREIGEVSRKTVEEYERAEREARRRGVDVWRILDG